MSSHDIKHCKVISWIQSIKGATCPLESGFLLAAVTAVFCHLTLLSLRSWYEWSEGGNRVEESGLCHAEQDKPSENPCDGANNAEENMEILCSGKDPIDEVKGLQDVEEYYNSSDIYSLLKEGEAFMETVFGSKLEYVARKVKIVNQTLNC